MTRIAVLGAGIAGLTVAYRLQERGYDVYLLEKRGRPGGAIHSTSQDGFLIEHGPATIRASTPLLEDLLPRLGLSEQVIEASERAKRRYVVRADRAVPIPTSPLGLLRTPLLSRRGKLRLLTEPFVSPSEHADEESVADFFERRFGPEAVTYGADPVVTGIFAGDPHRLAVKHVFPKLVELEREHGSILRGLWQRRQQEADNAHLARYRIFSFRKGIAQLPLRLADAVDECLHLETEVVGLAQQDGEWIVRLRQDEAVSVLRVDGVVATLPLPAWKHLEGSLADNVAPLLKVTYPPVATLTLGFQSKDVGHPLDGFGMLIPSTEKSYTMLGAIFTSSIFPEHVPRGHVLISARIGGMRQPELARLPMMDLRRGVLADLKKLLQVKGEPVLTHHAYWPQAIPQYTVDYDHVLQHLATLEDTYPGLFFAGNYRHGISVTDAMESGQRAAEAVTTFLQED